MLLLQNTITTTFASASSQSLSPPHLPSLFSFFFHLLVFSPREFPMENERTLSLSSLFTPHGHVTNIPSEKTYGLKLWRMALRQAFTQVTQSSRKWFPLFHSHINVLIFTYCNKGFIFSYIYIIGFLSFEIIDYHYYRWLIG